MDVPYSPALVAGSANIDISFWLNTTHTDPNSGDYDLVRMGDYPFQEYKVELEPNGQLELHLPRIKRRRTLPRAAPT